MSWIQESPTEWRSNNTPFLLRNIAGRPILFLRDSAVAGSFLDLTDLFANPISPAGTPAGYMQTSFSRSGADVTLLAGSRLTLNGTLRTIQMDLTQTLSGAAGWYYATYDGINLGFEKVQASEIVADTERYSPTPAFSVADGQYYPAVSSSERAIAACYWDGVSVISHFYAYGSGRIKNDSRVLLLGSQAAGSSGRARFGPTPTYQHGDDVLSWADDGTAGTTLTVQRPGMLFVTVTGDHGGGSPAFAAISRNQPAPAATDVPSIAQTSFINGPYQFLSGAVPVQPGDVIGFYLNGVTLTNNAAAKFIARLQELPQ